MTYFKKPYSSNRSRPKVEIDVATVYQEELPDLIEGSNHFAWACCPFHDDHNPSFCVNLDTGWFRCFSSSCGETGTNILSFVSVLHDLDYSEARRYMEAHYG